MIFYPMYPQKGFFMSKDSSKFLENMQKDFQELITKKYKGEVILSNPVLTASKNERKQQKKSVDFNFDIKPLHLEAYLKKYIIGQDQAISVIATKICTHFNRMMYEKKKKSPPIVGNIKSNILMIGPTGVGKTYLIKLVADKLGVPFVKADATKFTETGYVGGDVEDLVRELVREANGNITLAEYGIIYIDEIDKIASSSNLHGPDISRAGVQRNLLKVMEENEVNLRNPMDIASQMETALKAQKTGKIEYEKINTKNILFVVSGAFQGLTDIIQKRLNTQNLGFQTSPHKDIPKSSIFSRTNTQDLIDFGFESEFVGRLPVLAILDSLNENQLYQILKNSKSNVILSKKRDFLAYSIKLSFQDRALIKIAATAYKEKTGARSLMAILEKLLLPFEKYLPSSSIKSLWVTPELVDNPQEVLYQILTVDAVDAFCREFYEKHAIQLEFSKEAMLLIHKKAQKEKVSALSFISRCFKNYGHGLKLIGCSHLTITGYIIENHQEYLDNLIKYSYESKQ